MISQIYLDYTHNFFNSFINHPPFAFEFYIGNVETYKVIEDKNNCFISLGGDASTPVSYKFLANGWVAFNFKIFGLNRFLNDKSSSYAIYELWIEGLEKPYYHFKEKSNGNMFDTTMYVKGKKDQIAKFKFRLNIEEVYSYPPRENNYYYQGSKETIYSCITAKFTPDEPIQQKKLDSIIVTNDTELKMNRRYIVKAPILKTLQLSIDKKCKVGDWIEIKNMDLGNFQINSGNDIDIVMYGKTTGAKNGYIKSSKMADFLRLECMETSPRIVFSDTQRIGNYVIV